jgi:hypothetical protein
LALFFAAFRIQVSAILKILILRLFLAADDLKQIIFCLVFGIPISLLGILRLSVILPSWKKLLFRVEKTHQIKLAALCSFLIFTNVVLCKFKGFFCE